MRLDGKERVKSLLERSKQRQRCLNQAARFRIRWARVCDSPPGRAPRFAGLAEGRRGFCFTGEMHPNDRSRLAFIIRYAVRHRERIVPHARRLACDGLLRLRNRDHMSYYRAVMRSDAARSGEGAVGSRIRESWLKIGQMQSEP